MKKITLKFGVFLLLAMVSFQAQAQEIHTEIVVGVQYNLRNLETDQYLRVTGNIAGPGEDPSPGSVQEVLTMVDYPEENDHHINFHFGTIENGGEMFWECAAQARGILRMKGSGGGYGALSTAFQLGRNNTDKMHTITFNETEEAFAIHNKSGSTSLVPVDEEGVVVLKNLPTAEILDNSGLWVLEVSEMTEPVASVNTFRLDAFSVSNPVNNQLTIRGAVSKVQRVSLYSVLGSKVLTKSVYNANENIKLDVNSLSTGLYILEMVGVKGEKFTKKIVKQ